ncbi:MAG TPA: DUF2845 domain-containing protein [Candidatus Kapabacteria bacterium]|nr:DUF2845 domain-containing protein [Candidatus Kapabacteria bacterium]
MRSLSWFAFLAFASGTLLIAHPAIAGSMRCGRHIINEGASQYEVHAKCGDPVYQQLIEEPVTVISTSQASIYSRLGANGQNLQQDILLQEEQPMYRTIERWTYNFGSGRLLREVDFFNGDVIRIETGSRAP